MEPTFQIDREGTSVWQKPTKCGAGAGPTPTGTGLKVFNSLTKQLDPFIPNKEGVVTWYMCGPTVYDHSHLGHAKSYLQFDILYRIMTDYFGYNVQLCMNVTDIDDKIIKNSIEQKIEYNEFSRKWETAFFKDMAALNVRLPTVVTRVSEYVPEIVAYIEQIIANGFAYESNGSVYFNVEQYGSDPCHTYAKLEPSSVNDAEAVAEAEGSLTNTIADEKKSKRDFVLWKASKAGEPSWESPWGPGRPGWHIECSAMAHSIFKTSQIDIHSGGLDLRFPHHDNEIAQSEAYYGCDQWVNNWWHTGKLFIDGLKMSKSLKNYITIQNILQKYDAKQVRFLFLLHKWHAPIDYSVENSMKESMRKEEQFDQFFMNVQAILNTADVKSAVQKWEKDELELYDVFSAQTTAVHAALCNSFDTPEAINELFKLVNKTNIYIKKPIEQIKVPLLRQISRYVFKILKSFGLYDDTDFPVKAAGDTTMVTKLMNAFCEYRDAVKNNAKDPDAAKIMFKLSDQVRDDVLPELGIQIEDKGNKASQWKFDDPKKLMEKRSNELAEKARKEEEKLKKAQQALLKKSTSGKDYFKVLEAEKYPKIDEEGVPTHVAEAGKEPRVLSEPERNGLKKKMKKQQQVYEKWLAEQSNGLQSDFSAFLKGGKKDEK